MSNATPFLDVKSFITSETAEPRDVTNIAPMTSAFLSVYETEEGLDGTGTDEVESFLSELYDDEFDDAVVHLVNEASGLREVHFEGENAIASDYEVERFLDQHFSPLVRESEALFESVSRELGQRPSQWLSEAEIDDLIERREVSRGLAPEFEEFLGKLGKVVAKVAKKGLQLAKKGIGAVAKFGLGPILKKIGALVRPLLKRVIRKAMGKLPRELRPIAEKLGKQLSLLKELEEPAESGVGDIQSQFEREVAAVLFANDESEQNIALAKALNASQELEAYGLAEVDDAREKLTNSLLGLKEGEDPTPHIEGFIPAILPVLKVGIRIIGRKRVIGFLAKLLGKLIQKFVGPRYAPPLSRAIVDAGLKLIQLEATPEEEVRVAAEAVVGTVEETVQRIASLPAFVFEDQDLLEGFAIQAFEQAAAGNLPPVLTDSAYELRPELGEGRALRGVWMRRPRGRRKRYKKFSRAIPVRLTPYRFRELPVTDGMSLGEALEDEYALAPGEEVEGLVHLYELTAETQLSDIARLEADVPGLQGYDGHKQLHALTREAAELLLGEATVGRDPDSEEFGSAGQRYFYLEIPGRARLGVPAGRGQHQRRRRTGLKLVLDFPKNEVRASFFLGERRAQEMAVKLRQRSHTGAIVARLATVVQRGVRSALARGQRQLTVIHEGVRAGRTGGTPFERVPPAFTRLFERRLEEWILKGLAAQLKSRGEDFTQAANDTADGVTVTVTIPNPPGFPKLRQALSGRGGSLLSVNLEGSPLVSVNFAPGQRT
jgi:hypothetical protein